MESYAAFEQAVASTAEIVKGVRADQMAAPTPCMEWDVRTLLNHVLGTLWLSEALFTDAPPRHPMAPGGVPGSDLAGGDPAAAYAEASAAALPARRVILRLVAGDLRSVGEIASHLDITGQAVSRHLKVLHEAGLVDERREGTRHLFVVTPDGFSAVQEFLADFWPRHLGQLKGALADSGDPAQD